LAAGHEGASMSRRRIALGIVLVLPCAGLALWPFTWTPLPGVPLAEVPPLAAPLRTPQEHDRIQGDAEQLPIACTLEAPGDGLGRCLVLGFRHTSDPDSEQIRALRKSFAELAPTLVLVEGRLGWHVGGDDSVIRRYGESGAAVVLAHAAGVPCCTMEPDFDAEVQDTADAYGPERTLAFYFLRVFVSERDAGLLGEGERQEAEAAALLRKRGRMTGLAAALPDLAALDRFWPGSEPPHPDWRSLPKEALWRTAGEAWTQRIAEHVNAFRDRHMVAAILEGMRRGERILAVCGSSHLVLFEPALRAGAAKLGR